MANRNPRLDLYALAWMWEETSHELAKRLEIRVSRGLSERVASCYWEAAVRLKEAKVSEAPEAVYVGLKDEALCRLPRDPGDWHVVALALSPGADILTGDEDFLGCGVATWTIDTLISQLDRQ